VTPPLVGYQQFSCGYGSMTLLLLGKGESISGVMTGLRWIFLAGAGGLGDAEIGGEGSPSFVRLFTSKNDGGIVDTKE